MKTTQTFIIDYDTARFDFRGWACGVLGVSDLHEIHLRDDIRSMRHAPVTEQIEVCRKALAEGFADIAGLYDTFVAEVLGPLYDGIVRYQRPPSFRFHYSRRGSSAFHRDRDYGVLSGRYNCWLPLTRVWGDNSLWIESEEGREDYAAAELDYGQALIFDGANLHHGSKVNTTPSTRVSLDLRFAPRRPCFAPEVPRTEVDAGPGAVTPPRRTPPVPS